MPVTRTQEALARTEANAKTNVAKIVANIKKLDSAIFDDSKARSLLEDASNDKNVTDLAMFIGQNYLDFNDKITNLMHMFWEPAFDGSNIYCSREMIVNCFGYADDKYALSNFAKKQLSKFEENIDYFVVDGTHPLVNARNLWSSQETTNKSVEKSCYSLGNSRESDRNLWSSQDPTNKSVKKSCSDQERSRESVGNLWSSLGTTRESIDLSKTKQHGGAGMNKKHYVITGETFKQIMMTVRTAEGVNVREYYLCIEKLAIALTKIISKFVKITAEEQTNAAKSEAMLSKAQLITVTSEMEKMTFEVKKANEKTDKYKEHITKYQSVQKNQALYVATTSTLAKNKIYKYGGIDSIGGINRRLNSYNTGHSKTDPFYFVKIEKCRDYRSVEQSIKKYLFNFHETTNLQKEMLHIEYSCLDEFTDLVLSSNDKIEEFLEKNAKNYISMTIELPPTAHKPIDHKKFIKEHKLTMNTNNDDSIIDDLLDESNEAIDESNEAIDESNEAIDESNEAIDESNEAIDESNEASSSRVLSDTTTIEEKLPTYDESKPTITVSNSISKEAVKFDLNDLPSEIRNDVYKSILENIAKTINESSNPVINFRELTKPLNANQRKKIGGVCAVKTNLQALVKSNFFPNNVKFTYLGKPE